MLTRTAIINKGVECRVQSAAAEVAVNADGFHALIEADILRAVAGRGVVGGGQRFGAGEIVARAIQITAVVLKPRERSVRGRADLIKLLTESPFLRPVSIECFHCDMSIADRRSPLASYTLAKPSHTRTSDVTARSNAMERYGTPSSRRSFTPASRQPI